ncbi:acyl-CoA thioesterase [Deinococcus maricopensis]|uniref:acyl-CoA thioesterase n=1 Tax=Deinococcus maricopensis TaxID=309887 RepID=UPI0011D1DA21|nr:thioesterase family protein [Deinococcus maricopensis]
MTDALTPERTHTLTLSVQPSDIDDLGHVNNAVYLSWFEGVARAHADRVGADLPTLRALGVVPVARTHTIHYHRPALLGDEVHVTTVITESRGVRATRTYTANRADGTLLASCETQWVWVHPETGRPKAPPAELLARFGFHPETAR